MKVHVHYEYDASGGSTAEVTGDVDEFRDLLQGLGIMRAALPDKRDGGFQLRSLYGAIIEHSMAGDESTTTPRVSVRERRPLDKRAIMAEHGRVIAAHNQRAEQMFLDFLRDGKDSIPDEFRAQAVGTGSAGGFITPQSFADRFTQSLKQYDQLFDVARLLETDTGTACDFPVDDDTGAVATVVPENTLSLTTSPITFGTVSFSRCPMWRSGLINASTELVSDSAFDLAGLLAKSFAKRFSRGCGAAFVTQLLTDADVAVTSASPTVVTPDEALSLMGALDAAYSMNGSFMMSFSSYIAFLKQKGSTGGSYLLEPELDVQGYPTLFGRRVYLSPSFPAIAALAKSIAFGDMSRFIRRQVRNSLSVKVYIERYAEVAQIAYESFLRTDGKLAKATNSPLPVRLLQCHA